MAFVLSHCSQECEVKTQPEKNIRGSIGEIKVFETLRAEPRDGTRMWARRPDELSY